MKLLEVWKPIPGWEGLYEISNLANVRHLPYTRGKGKHIYGGKIIKPYKNNNGYWMVALMWKHKQKNMLLHRALAMAFIPNPNNLPFINHKDSDRANCTIDNLEWCDRSYNTKYSYDFNNRRAYMNWKKGIKHSNTKSVIQLSVDGKYVNKYESIMDTERATGIFNSNIIATLKGRQKNSRRIQMDLRSIKFKAKRLDNGKWVEGYFYAECSNAYIIEDRQSESMLNRNDAHQVDPSTVCQFTGLKDTNDVPIFEGDIIDFDGEGEVVFKDGAFYAKFGKYTECLLCNLVKSGLSVTIVGNKFEEKVAYENANRIE